MNKYERQQPVAASLSPETMRGPGRAQKLETGANVRVLAARGVLRSSKLGADWDPDVLHSARPHGTSAANVMVNFCHFIFLFASRSSGDALSHHFREGLCSEQIGVTLPPKPPARQTWMTRHEAARLIRAAYRHRETQNGSSTDRHTLRPIARFILVGLYTGTRASAICAPGFTPSIDGRGYIDLERGVFHRLPHGARETKKRQPAVRLPDRLLAHLRRWRRLGIAAHAVVEWNGKPVKSVRKGFQAAVRLAGSNAKITPHALWRATNGAN